MISFLLAAALFGTFEVAVRAVLFPEWRGLSPRSEGENPYFGGFTLPNLNIRRFSPANYDVINTTNRFGFRDREQGFEQDLSETWVFGDSNTFGMGLDDSLVFTALLDQMGLPTANLAGLGGDLNQYSRILKKLTEMGHRPKTVLIVLSMNKHLRLDSTVAPPNGGPDEKPGKETKNEPTTAMMALPADLLLKKIRALFRSEIGTFLGFKSILLRNIASYGYIKTQIVSNPTGRDWMRSKGLIQDIDLIGPGSVELTEVERQEDVESLAQSVAERLLVIKNSIVKTAEVRFAVVLLPTHHHLYPARFTKYLNHLGLDPEANDAAQPYNLFTKALDDRGIATIDVFHPLKASGNSQLIFYNDAHFNSASHKIIAQTLAAWLAGEGARQ